MTTSPSEPVDNDQSANLDESNEEPQPSSSSAASATDNDDQDSEPTSTAPPDENPTQPGG